MLLHVADLQKGVQFYRILYGKEAIRREESRAHLVSDWRHASRPGTGASRAEAAHRALRREGRRLRSRCRVCRTGALGAEVVPSPDEPDVVRFRDKDGNSVLTVECGTQGSTAAVGASSQAAGRIRVLLLEVVHHSLDPLLHRERPKFSQSHWKVCDAQVSEELAAVNWSSDSIA